MSRISQLFKKKKERILNIYFTAGFPELDSTLTLMKLLQENGADMIELGMPYSDPLADGPVIQSSGSRALCNGMTIAKLFEQLKDFRKEIDLPVVLMGYMNPILQFGFEKFCATCAVAGIDGLILPDLPEHEYELEYEAILKKYGLDFIFLVTPETSDARIRRLDAFSNGFLYAVSSSSITGKDKDFEEVDKYLSRLRSMNLKNPVLVGFGIKDRLSFQSACRHAAGAIIGTAFIRALENSASLKESVKGFMDAVLK
jgi:tryptophan synthase alpha chain